MNQNELSVLKEDSACQLYVVVINTIFFFSFRILSILIHTWGEGEKSKRS